jgi:polyhydroxyalkanoate synthesis regulator phasin
MGLGDLVQKAVYLGVGLASIATEKAGETLTELRGQLEKMADEMVERGEMTTEEAKKFVDDMVKKAQQPDSASTSPAAEPRRIEILDDEPASPNSPEQTQATAQPSSTDVDEMRRRVIELQEELRRLQNP